MAVSQPGVTACWKKDPASPWEDRGVRPLCVGGGSWIDLLGAALVCGPEQGFLTGLMV